MRNVRAWMIALSLGAALAALGACGDDTNNPPSGSTTSSTSTGTGGSGGSGGGSTGTMGGGGGMPPECTVASDCKNNGTADFCGQPACNAGHCEREILQPSGTALPSQTYGDCQKWQCDAKGNKELVNDDTDAFNDGNECTDDLCMSGILMHTPKAQGYLCTTGICSADGACVQCISGVQSCTINGQICINGACAGSKCDNGVKDPGETDIDCGGGNCLKCDDGKACAFGPQCKSGVCTMGMCAAPTCMDGIQNGKETITDCGGGDCSPCDATAPCISPTDCKSGVCFNTQCAEPACTDAVQNGDETGIDCGGPCPTPCLN